MSTPTIARPGAGLPPGGGQPAARWWNPAPVTRPARQTAPQLLPIRVFAALATLCTALCLGNIFDGFAWWFWPCAGAVAVAALIGEFGRRLRIPAVAMWLFYVVLGWCYVVPVAARGSAELGRAGLLPSGATFDALRAIVNSATGDIRSLTVPVPDRPGFLLLTVAGVYLVAALTDFVAVTLAAPAAAGLPLLALLAVPAALVERGVGLLAFIASCAAYLLLIFVSGRRGLARWARLPVGAAPRFRRVTAHAGRRIGAVALVAALVIPALIPRYEGLVRHHGAGGGGGSATVIEPVVTLAQQLHDETEEPLISVQTTTPEYLRLTALEHFDGQHFTLGKLEASKDARVTRGLPKVKAAASIQVKQTITVLPILHQRYLPFAYQPSKITVDGDWRLSGQTYTIFSAKTDTSGKTYSVTSEVPTPTAEELRSQSADQLPSSVSPSTELPSNLPVEIGQLANQITQGLSTEYDKVAAIQAFLRGPDFTYDLARAPTGPDALLKFLTTDKRGYCEQFAGAMTVLVRQAGIPARVAVGFTPGTRQADGSWLITNHDAHAWPEVWFPQAGWVRFEPTPRDPSTLPPSYTLAPAPASASATPSTSASQSTSPTPTAGPSSTTAVRSNDPAAAAAASGGGGGTSIGVILAWILGPLAALGLLLIPAVLRARRRWRRLAGAGAGDTSQAWQEITDTALDLGLDLAPTLSPRRAVEQLHHGPTGERLMPEVSFQVFGEVAHAEELARYAEEQAPQLPDLENRLRVALGAWQRSQDRRTRLVALLAPRSLASGIRGPGGGFSSDDSVEASAAR